MLTGNQIVFFGVESAMFLSSEQWSQFPNLDPTKYVFH